MPVLDDLPQRHGHPPHRAAAQRGPDQLGDGGDLARRVCHRADQGHPSPASVSSRSVANRSVSSVGMSPRSIIRTPAWPWATIGKNIAEQ